jgi:UDP-GlcNAc:undecaprenyl-phosphate/decaprenyl-phosphate GlcNAc-1-phosphate transferase
MNGGSWELFWLPAILAAAVSFVVSGGVVATGKGLKIIDDPKKHRHPKVVHDRPVPRGGGIPVFAALALGSWLFLPLENKTLGIMTAAAMLAAVGFLDDRYEETVSPYVRLVINIVAALTVIGVGIGIAFITNPLGGILRLDTPKICFWLWGSGHCIWVLSDLIALVWLVWMQNTVGWSSGVDGQLPGFVIVAAITIAILGLRAGGDSSQTMVIILAGLIAGAYAGFLPWNWYPQKIMPGYGGKSLAGFLLGLLAILSGAKVGALFMVLAMPFIDAALVIIKRVKEGRSPVWGGREHLHHLLLERGWGKRRIALFYWGISLVLAVLALQLKAELKYFTMATVFLVLAGGIWWLQNWSIYSKQSGPDSG